MITKSTKDKQMTNQHSIESIIEQLEHLSYVLNNAHRGPEHSETIHNCSYPFAVGFCQAGISNAVFDLRRLMN